MKKRIVSILLTVVMFATMIPFAATPVFAADNITEYDCLDVAAGAYIDTGIKPNENTRVVMDIMVMGKVEYWFGVWDIDFCHSAFALGNDSNGIYSGYYNEGGTDGSVVSDGRHKVELDKGVVKVDNAVILKHGRIPFTLNNTLYLFAQNRNGQVGLRGNEQTGIRFYSCQIFEGKNLVRNFVPAMNGSKVGVYDQVGKNFYANKGNGNMKACVSCLVWENGSFVTKYFSGKRLLSDSEIRQSEHMYYAMAGKTVFKGRVELNGENTLILCDGADLVFEKGIQLEYGGTLNIYAQSQSGNMGRLTVYGYGGNAAIGGNCGIGCAENPLDRDGKPGGTVNIHGGNIEVYSESVGFGGGDGGKGYDSREGINAGKNLMSAPGETGYLSSETIQNSIQEEINAGKKASGGVGGDAMGGAIYGGNIVLHSGRALFGGGNGGDSDDCRSETAGPMIDENALFRIHAGAGGDGGAVAHILLNGGSVKLPTGASLVRGGDGGDGGNGVKFNITDSVVKYGDEIVDVNGIRWKITMVCGASGGAGGTGGDVRDVRFCDGSCNINGNDICIRGGSGGNGGNGADVVVNTIVNIAQLCPGNGGNGGDGGKVKMYVKGGDSTVIYGSRFISGGSGGDNGFRGESEWGSYSPDGVALPKNGEKGNDASCELNIHAGKLTVSSASGKLMGSGVVNYYDYMAARLGKTLDSLGQAGRYNAGEFSANACAVIESTREIVPPVEHNGNNYWLNANYSSMYFLSDDVKGDVTVDLKGHTWTVTGEKIFGYGVTMIEIKNGTLIFTNPNCDAFVVENGLRLTNVTFKDCTCERLFYISEDKTTKSDDYSEFVVKNCTFTNCSFTKDGGAFFFACKSSPRWYYLFENDIFDNIKTTGNGSAMYIHAYNGGMYNGKDWPSLDLVGCTFNKCHADGSGGAIYAMENMRIGNFLDECGNKDRSENNVRSNLFVNCSAGENGGALFNAGWDCSTLYCMFVSCSTSETYAVYSGQQPVHFSKCDFIGNNNVVISHDKNGKEKKEITDMNIFHDDSYGHGVEAKDVIYDMSQYSKLDGNGTENDPYILKTVYDIAFLAAKCAVKDTKYSYAVYQLDNDITDVFTPVSGFNGILNTYGMKIKTRFTGDAFTGTYGINGTLTVEDLFGNVQTENTKSNFLHMESSHPYNRNYNEWRTYIRPGASSITLTFSEESSVFSMCDDWIAVYDGNGTMVHKYTSPEIAGQTIKVLGDTVQIQLASSGHAFLNNDSYSAKDCYGFKVSKLTVTYPTGLGSVLSQGSIWIIAAVAAVAVAGVAALVIVKKKKKPVLASGENTDE